MSYFTATDNDGDQIDIIALAKENTFPISISVKDAESGDRNTVLLSHVEAKRLYTFIVSAMEPQQAPEQAPEQAPKPTPRQITGARLYDATGGMILFELQGDNITVDTTKPVSLPLSALVDAVQALSGE